MTVTSTNQKVTFNGNGSTTVFAYNFKIFADADLLVVLRVTATGAETTQTLTTNYTVSGAGETSGGNVTMGTAPASGTTLTVLRAQINYSALTHLAICRSLRKLVLPEAIGPQALHMIIETL